MKTITLDEIKEFAHSQLGSEHPAVSVTDGEFDIVDPWYSTSSMGKYLTDEEAEKNWGKELVTEFMNKAKSYLENK